MLWLTIYARGLGAKGQCHDVVIATAVDAARVTGALGLCDLVDQVDRAVNTPAVSVECKHHRQLFSRKRMHLADALLLDHEESAVRSDLDSSQFGNPGSGLSDNLDRRNVPILRPHNGLQVGLFRRSVNTTTVLDGLRLTC